LKEQVGIQRFVLIFLGREREKIERAQLFSQGNKTSQSFFDAPDFVGHPF